MNFENFKEKNKIRWHKLDDLKCEKWVDIKGFEGLYQVSNYGRVKSLSKTVNKGNGTRITKTRILKYGKDEISRLNVNLCKNNKTKSFRVHRLVIENFINCQPENTQVCHNNGKPFDNRLKNLRYDTAKNNQADKIKHGTLIFGEKSTNSKLTERQVKEIYELLKTKKYYQKEIGEIYKIGQVQVSDIKNKKSWKHLNLS